MGWHCIGAIVVSVYIYGVCGEIQSFIKPLHLELDGISFCAPAVADWDKDGLIDLVIGYSSNNTGYVAVYRNVGTKTAPEFSSSGTILKADGNVISVGST